MLPELDQLRLFKGLSSKQLEEISQFSSLINYHDGDVLITEGAEDKDLFVLIDGYVEIVSNDGADLSGEVVLSSNDKEMIGEISWLTNEKRTAGVRCHGSVDAIRINGVKLAEYLENVPEAGYKVTRQIAVMLSERIQDSNSLLKQILWNKHL